MYKTLFRFQILKNISLSYSSELETERMLFMKTKDLQ